MSNQTVSAADDIVSTVERPAGQRGLAMKKFQGEKLVLTIGRAIGDGETLTHTAMDVIETAADVLALEAFTAYECAGWWHGVAEKSVRIEVNAGADELRRIYTAVPALTLALGQECIMCEFVAANASFKQAVNVPEFVSNVVNY